jgi:type IV pilus assembly protein PilZ
MSKTEQIRYAIDTQSSLYLAYMPFIKGGGIFIRTLELYSLGSSLSLQLKLLNEEEWHCVEGKIVWITPKTVQGNKLPGIGVQFKGEQASAFRNKIESYLTGMLTSFQLTDTI